MSNSLQLPYGVSLERLATLCEVSEHGSIMRAARITQKKQSQISRQIKELEEALGYSLLDRSTKPHRLTPAALDLEKSVRSFYEDFQITQSRLREDKETITIAAGESLILWFLMPLIAKSKVWQNFHIHFRNSQSAQAVESLKKGHIDLAIHSQNENLPTLSNRPLLNYGLCLIAPASAQIKSRQWDTLPSMPVTCIGGNGNTHRLIQELTEDHPKGPQLAIESTSHQQVLEMVNMAGMLGVIPSFGAKKAAELGLDVIQISELKNRSRQLSASWSKNKTPVLDTFLQILNI